jgi:hypothetical protein
VLADRADQGAEPRVTTGRHTAFRRRTSAARSALPGNSPLSSVCPNALPRPSGAAPAKPKEPRGIGERKNPRSQRVSPGVFRSRLRDSNPRPTHDETVRVRVVWCPVVLSGAVLPDQSMYSWLTDTASYCTVQRRQATGWPPGGFRATSTARLASCRTPPSTREHIR